ncbi:MAG: signal peptidase II [Candidatus Omnitrophica bacterium]|nr:signal peptidase II [Candidatus Omnitrophota bacterium]
MVSDTNFRGTRTAGGVPRRQAPPRFRPWLIAAATVGIDQAAKLIVRAAFVPAQSLPVIPPVFHLTYVQNTGAAFGLLQGHPEVFVILSVVVAGWMIRELLRRRLRARLTDLALALILGGAVGNLIDRVRFGYVVDFLDFRVWPVFNVADSCISVGVGLLLLSQFRRCTRSS